MHRAVADVSLDVPTGTIYGFIGPNGSGKTTTIRMILDILVPDAGTIAVLGRPSQSAVRDQIGYLPEERGLYKRMTVRQVLRYYGQLKGRSIAELNPVIDTWLERLDLAKWADKRVQTLSKGMSQKVQFISTIVSRPQLLVLDEPFSGLDVTAGLLFRALLTLLSAQGRMVLFSSHRLDVVQRVCSRVVILSHGRIVAEERVRGPAGEHSVQSLEDVFIAVTAPEDYSAQAREIFDVVRLT